MMRGGTPVPHPPETTPHFLPLGFPRGFILMETSLQAQPPNPWGRRKELPPKPTAPSTPTPRLASP